MNEKKTKGFFDWLFHKLSFWIIAISYSVWSGFEELAQRNITEFLANSAVCFILVGIIYFIVYLIINGTKKKVIEEIKK